MSKSLAIGLLILSIACLNGGRPGAAITALPLISDQSFQDRRDSLERIWKAVADNYYDPDFNGVNWKAVRLRYRAMLDSVKSDEGFYELMERMVGELHDSHTHVLSPTQTAEFKQHQRTSLGFGPEIIDDQLVVARVTAGSQAEQAGLEPGMIVRTVNGRPLKEKVSEIAGQYPASSTSRATKLLSYHRVFIGAPGSTIKLGLERADGSSFEVTLTRQLVPETPDLVTRVLPSGNAYMGFNIFYAPVAQQFGDALKKIRDAPGLIIDLRRNPGGTSHELIEIASDLFLTKTVLARYKTRASEARPLYLLRRDHAYSGAIVILTGPQTGSSSELFAAGLQDTGRAKIVGSQSCGCVLGVNTSVELKDGGEVIISDTLWFTPHGRKLEGEGVIPDRIAAVTLDDLRRKRDPVLEAGDHLLKGMTQAAAAQK
jgi:carboxyl-terminal processing protease